MWFSRTAPVFLVLSISALLDGIPRTDHALLIAPTTGGEGGGGFTSQSQTGNNMSRANDVDVIDLSQSFGDVGLLSIAIPVIVQSWLMVFFTNGKTIDDKKKDGVWPMTSVHAPIAPQLLDSSAEVRTMDHDQIQLAYEVSGGVGNVEVVTYI
jgi:hypothetical protein